MPNLQARKFSVFTRTQRLTLLVLCVLFFYFLAKYALWWFEPTHIPYNWPTLFHLGDFAIFGLLSFAVFLGTILRIGSIFTLWHLAKPEYISPQKGLKVALLTCFVPQKEPIEMLEKTLRAMKNVHYKHDSWVLDEGNSAEVKKLCKKLSVKYFTRFGIEKYNQQSGKFRTKTKAGNHNAWADTHGKKYDIIAQIDMDHVPQKDFFEKTLGYFQDPKVGFVGSPQFYKNTKNWISKGAAQQAFAFQGPMQQGFYGCDMPFLIGTSHVYRRCAMEKIGGYAPTIVEDHLTGMQFFAHGYKGVYVPEILARGEGPLNWVDYFNQQMRWSYGLFEILFKHTPKLMFKLRWKHKINYFISQLYYFTGVTVIIGFFLTFFYLVFGIRSASMDVFEWVKYSFPPFLMASLIQIYAHKFSIDPKNEPTFGFLGMFLNIGANIIYAIAFLKFITGRKLKYMVTKKGSAGKHQQVSISAFSPHIAFATMMLFALVVSYFNGHTAFQLRFWALFNFLSLLAVSVSTYSGRISKLLAFAKFALVPAKYAASAALVLLVFLGLLYSFTTYDGTVKAAFDKQFGATEQAQIAASKITPPQNGAYLGVSLYQHNDTNYLNKIQDETGKKFAIVGYYQAWGVSENRFDQEWAKNIAANGSIPLITWEPWVPVSGFDRSESAVNQPAYRLQNIVNGQYDDYIKQYAQDVKDYKKPVIIRFAHEMNGNWYPWGSTFNKPQDYILAWRHVHEIFDSVGATNATWVWSPNEPYIEESVPYANQIEAFYPGDDYVDWVGFSAFNWAGMYKQNVWESPQELYSNTLSRLEPFKKPLMITETASAETYDPAQKAQWIQQLAKYVQDNPQIKGLIWFDVQDNGVNWTINSSEQSTQAFKDSFGQYFLQKAN